MSIDKITSKILSDAEASAKEVTDEAKAASDAILEEAKKKADELTKNAAEKGATEKEKLITRRRAVADIDGRKIILDQKQQLIAECFDKAVGKITSMDKEKYVDFLAGIVKKTGVSEGELIMNPKESAEIGPALVARLKEIMPESGITLSGETRNIKGGFMLKNGSVYINGTVEALIDEARDELVTEVAQVLFQ